MLHELFLALAGHGSSMFDTLEVPECNTSLNYVKGLETQINSSDTLEDHDLEKNTGGSTSNFILGNVIGSSSLLHPCEIQIISEILKVASHFKKILKFHEKVVLYCISVTEGPNETGTRRGHYLTSLATAIYEETKIYQKKIVDLEREYLESAQLLLSTILLNVTPFIYVFTELNHLINVVEEERLHGCKILDYLHKKILLSVGEIQEVFKRIKYAVQKILIEQLTHWLLQGELLDPHKELFLKVTKNSRAEECMKLGLQKENSIKEEIESGSLLLVEVSLEVEMLPEFIPFSAAEKILFIGESILCFEKGDLNSKSGMILKEREKEFLDRFEILSHQNSFSITEFLDLIECVRLCVAKHLYDLVVEAGLHTELNCIKDIFLLGRGELYHAFFILYDNKKPNTVCINTLFQRAGRQVMIGQNVLDKFVVTYEEPRSVSTQEHVWKKLRIDYKVEWPLHKFFDSKVQDKYNIILRFLLDIRQSQLRLQYLWISQKNNKMIKYDNLEVLCWTLRHHMSLLIYNIQYYIQVDVLESRYNELKEELNSLKDYQHLNFQHQTFLSSITTQCFLSHPIISSSIFYILEKVNSFCNLLEVPPKPQLRSQIEKVKEDFDRASSKFLWALMNTLGKNRNCRHTSQLVMRIDYNRFFTKNNAHRFLEQA